MLPLLKLGKNNYFKVLYNIDVVLIPDGTMVQLDAGTEVMVLHKLGGAFTIRTRHCATYRVEGVDAKAIGCQPFERPIPDWLRSQRTLSDETIRWAIEGCYDPEIPVNIIELGLIYGWRVLTSDGRNTVQVEMTLTAPGCGMGAWLQADVRRQLMKIPTVDAVEIELTFDPPWDSSRMSEVARLTTGLL